MQALTLLMQSQLPGLQKTAAGEQCLMCEVQMIQPATGQLKWSWARPLQAGQLRLASVAQTDCHPSALQTRARR